MSKRYVLCLVVWAMTLPAQAFPRLIDSSLHPDRTSAARPTITINLDLPETLSEVRLTPIGHPEPLRIDTVEWRQPQYVSELAFDADLDTLSLSLPEMRTLGAADIVIELFRNPRQAGVYLYAISAVTERGERIPVGMARLNVYERNETTRLR